MKLNLERETLLKPLQMVMGVVERKQTLPILSNILLDASDNKISITGTDLEVELVGQTQLTHPASDVGKLTLPGRKLMDICKALPENAAIELYKDKDQVIVQSGRSRFTLSTLPAEEFPNVEQPHSTIQFNVPQSELRTLLHHCAFSMAQQDVRYYLNGLLFEVGANYLRGVATDGHRLAAVTLNNVKTPDQDKVQVIIPRKGVIELQRLLNTSDDPVTIEISDNHIRAITNSYKFTSKLIEGRFPDYERVIPKSTTKEISLEREFFKDALNRVAILCNEKFRGLRFEFRHNKLRILANNPEQEAAEEELGVSYDDDDIDIGFNVSYLIDIINTLNTDAVTLNFTDANSSLMIKEEQDNISSVYVVMPMRL